MILYIYCRFIDGYATAIVVDRFYLRRLYQRVDHLGVVLFLLLDVYRYHQQINMRLELYIYVEVDLIHSDSLSEEVGYQCTWVLVILMLSG